MELVDDDHVEVVGRNACHVVARETLNGGEHVLPLLGLSPIDIELAERLITQHVPERQTGLVEDLSPVRHESQTSSIQFPSEPSVIKCGYDGLAGHGGGDDQVAPAAMSMPFNGKVVQHLYLKR